WRAVGAVHRVVGIGILLDLIVEVPKQSTNIEPSRGVAHERNRVARKKLAARDALREVVAKSPGAGGDRSGRKVVEVMQDHVLSVCATSFFPMTELRRHPGVVFQLAERVEASEARNQHDMNARVNRGA